jgi:hypothetical protein
MGTLSAVTCVVTIVRFLEVSSEPELSSGRTAHTANECCDCALGRLREQCNSGEMRVKRLND